MSAEGSWRFLVVGPGETDRRFVAEGLELLTAGTVRHVDLLSTEEEAQRAELLDRCLLYAVTPARAAVYAGLRG